MSISIHQLKNRAKETGVDIEVDDASQCYRAVAPDGFRYEPQLHELIAVFGDGFIGNGETKASARADLYERLGYYDQLEKCDHECGDIQGLDGSPIRQAFRCLSGSWSNRP